MRIALNVSIIALLVLATACGGGSSTNPTLSASTVDCKSGPATVEGKFLSPNATVAVAGGQVSISTASSCKASTAKDGAFKFLNVPATTATVTATKGVFNASVQATPGTPVQVKISPNAVKIAYIPGAYDKIQDVVTRLGFTSTQIQTGDLATADLSQYQVILFNCGCDTTQASDPTTLGKVRTWVQNGGIMYASDFADEWVTALFPSKVNFLQPDEKVGEPGVQTATIMDEVLKLALGKATAQIDFNLGSWAVVDSVSTGVDLLISGPAKVSLGSGPQTLQNKPYAAQFAVAGGRVTYTSFHNEAQTTADMDQLLEQMLLGL